MQELPTPAARLARIAKVRDTACVALFALAIAAPTIDEFVRPPEARSPRYTEMRKPADKPVLLVGVQEMNAFPAAYEEWFLDAFGLRDKLLRWGSIERLFVFGVSPTESVDIGRDGWMFYAEDASLEVYRGRLPFSEGELDAWQRMLENHREVAEELGMKSLFVIGPNKETIYPEYVPPSWTKVGPTRWEQLDRKLGAAAKGLIFDMRPAFLAEKPRDEPDEHLYYELGTHWNGRGCYLAYKEIISELAKTFPKLAPRTMEELGVAFIEDPGDTWARAMYSMDLVPQKNRMLGAERTRTTEYRERGVRVWISEGSDPTLPRAVMYHDSFGQSIQLLLAPHFSRFVCYWTADVSDEVIQREKADVLLEVFVERALVNLAPQQHMLGHGQLSSVVFDRSRRTLLELGRQNARDVLEPRGDLAIEVPAGDEVGVARVTLGGPRSYLVLRTAPLPPAGDVLVRIDVDAPAETECTLLPIWKGESEPRRKQTTQVHLPVGASTQYLRLPRTKQLDRIALRFGTDAGTFTIRGLEARGMPGQ